MLAGCVDWPEAEARRYRELGYWQSRTLGGELRQWAARYGDRTALVGGGRRFTYLELDQWADRLAAGLSARGVKAGDRIVVQLPNVPEFVALCFGLHRLGALPVFALPAHRRNEIGHLGQISEAVAYVVPDVHQGFDYRPLAKEISAEVPSIRETFVVGDPGPFAALADAEAEPAEFPDPDPADVAFFLLSGGTTALPKLIPRTHDDYAYQVRTSAGICGLGEDGVYLAVLPLPFNFTWGCPGILGVLSCGGTAVLARNRGPDECFALIEAEKVTLTSIVPTIAHLWLDGLEWVDHDLSSLRLLQIGSAKLHEDVARRIEPAFGCSLQQVFGMAEGLLCMTRADDDAQTIATTQGSAISPADELRVVDPAGQQVPPGTPGELLTRGPYTLRGYYRAPEHNRTAFDTAGFYRTGDLIRLTEAGNVVVEGRVKDRKSVV